MPKRSSKHRGSEDINETVFRVFKASVGEDNVPSKTLETEGSEIGTSSKNPAAVEIGRLGGLKGGRLRAEKLSSERRSEIAKNAAQTRWNTNRKTQ